MRYQSKAELLRDLSAVHGRLLTMLRSIPLDRYREPGVWGDNWNIADLVVHLVAWHELFLGWHDAGMHGLTPAMPAPGYKWSETPRLNRAIWEQHQHATPADVLKRFDASHARIVALAETLTEQQLLEPGHFAWTRDNALVTYLGANSASHYRFALKVIKRWLRKGPADRTGHLFPGA